MNLDDIDAIISEKIMGLTVVRRDLVLDGARVRTNIPYVLSSDDRLDHIEGFSVSLSSAWKIVEILQSGKLSGYGNRPVVLDLSYNTIGKWRCEFTLANDNAGDDRSMWLGKADTPSLAICLAAIDFLEIETGSQPVFPEKNTAEKK